LVDGVVCNFQQVTVSGDMNSVFSMMDQYKDGRLTDASFNYLGTGADVALTALGFNPVLGPILAPISVLVGIKTELDRLERDGVLQDGWMGSVANAAKDHPVLKECGFALNLRLDENSRPGAYLTPETKVYMSNDARETYTAIADAYNASNTYHGVDAATYTADSFIEGIQDDPYAAVVSTSGASTNATRSFLEWCDKPADLVYKVDVERSDGRNNYIGDKVIDSPSNYGFITKQDTLFAEYQYPWE